MILRKQDVENILKKCFYQLDQRKNDFFRRSLLFNMSSRVCVFTCVVRSSDFTMLFSLSIQDFGVSRPFILAMCIITFSASATLLLETSHRKLSGKILKEDIMNFLFHHIFLMHYNSCKNYEVCQNVILLLQLLFIVTRIFLYYVNINSTQIHTIFLKEMAQWR